ncbi:hypothetical protein EYF80_040285 [Liparis tanakae]|uniref:Uncharacterized protein n=1 Tax=Liparis tanakae TaxID=230148 RepID=A0A4Z2G916_9TELE|nr:hypothetical protein EYF80_040285 [Liparis tanakae]
MAHARSEETLAGQLGPDVNDFLGLTGPRSALTLWTPGGSRVFYPGRHRLSRIGITGTAGYMYPTTATQMSLIVFLIDLTSLNNTTCLDVYVSNEQNEV